MNNPLWRAPVSGAIGDREPSARDAANEVSREAGEA